MSDEETIEQKMGRVLSAHMSAILNYFHDDAVATLVVRVPGKDESEFVLTNDDPKEAIKAIERRLVDPDPTTRFVVTDGKTETVQ